MNYVWEAVIKAIQEDMDLKDIRFSEAEIYSPYMELSNKCINARDVEAEVQINPYYRFYEIFKDICNINYLEDKEIKKFVFDIVVHFLTAIDLNQGLNKIEYYMKFIGNDILQGCLGDKIKNNLCLFTRDEQLLIIGNIYKLYTTEAEILIFKNTIKNIFKKSIVYVNKDSTSEILVFLNVNKTKENIKK